ncbi:MAG: uridine phosphorylase [Caldisericia bacterium]|nr:uridine phosphorylase [Caldisericia bacterium]
MNHLALTEREIQFAKIACITGNPNRIEALTNDSKVNAVILQREREFTIALAHINNIPVLLASHGIGGSSTEILVEELSQLGITTILRIGTSGAIQPKIHQGEVVISQASVRLDGVTPFYAPIEYPAISSSKWVDCLEKASKHVDIPYHTGITASTASFYPGQERYDTKTKYIIPKWRGAMKQWEMLNVLNYEMESSTLFILGSLLGLEVGCITSIVAERSSKEDIIEANFDPFSLSWKIGWKAIEFWINEYILKDNQ